MSKEIIEAAANHPISTGIATTVAGLPIVDLLDLASNVTTLIAGVMGIAVSYFFIQFHRSNTKVNEVNAKINELRLKQMLKDEE